jgi:hypothetical protein
MPRSIGELVVSSVGGAERQGGELAKAGGVQLCIGRQLADCCGEVI